MRATRYIPRSVRSASLTAVATAVSAVLIAAIPSAAGARSQARPAVAAPRSTAPKGTPTAVLFDGVPTVGALLRAGRKGHFCTASVVDSAAGDLVVTAAHCVYTRARGYSGHLEFVPGYRDGKRPYGTWAVRKITVASGWRRFQDPNLDVAFLAVGSPRGPGIQSRTGGLRLGTGGPGKETVVPAGYNDTDGRPVKCRTESFGFRPGQMEFYCRNFAGGTSGGPWIAGFNPRTGAGTVIGVIGGYEQGGDYDWASYSPYFSSAVRALFRRAGGGSAERGGSAEPRPGPRPPKPQPARVSHRRHSSHPRSRRSLRPPPRH